MPTTTTKWELTIWESINSQDWPKNNSPNNTSEPMSQNTSTPLIALMTWRSEISIGNPKVPLHQSRTKVNADHAGLSQLLEDLKVSARLPTEPLKASQNNNSLIAQPNTETMPATVDLWTTPSNSLRTTESFTKINIPTRLLNKPALKLEDHSRFQASLISRTATLWLLPSSEDPSQSLLMLPTGLPTKLESSTDARPN